MSSSADLVICGLGAQTPVGRTAAAAAAAVRASISRLGAHAFMVDSRGEPIVVAECSWLAAQPSLVERIGQCLEGAVREAMAPLLAASGSALPRPVLFVNLPAPRPGLPGSLSAAIEARLRQLFAGMFARIDVHSGGHAGSFQALVQVARAVAVDSSAVFVVAGSDSYLEPDTLEWLEETDQLHGAGPRNNAWGFPPGEGAGALLVLAPSAAKRAGLTPLASVAGVSIATETSLIRSGRVCLGLGLTSAFSATFRALSPGQRVNEVYCDMNGEPYRADEYGFAVTRTREFFVSATDFWTPADCWGDVGAASAALTLLLACVAQRRAYARGPNVLVWASSDTGERGSALVTPPEEGRQPW